MKTIITFLICISIVKFSFGQIELKGRVYTDTTLTESLSKVKLTLKSENFKKVFRSDKHGNFNIIIEEADENYSLEIKKKEYITILFEPIPYDSTKSELIFDVILRKALPVDSDEYDGPSELIMRN